MNTNMQESSLFSTYSCFIWNIKILPVISGIYVDLFPFAYKKGGIKVKGKKNVQVKSIHTDIDDLV